jgi:hypothetical protein
MRFADAKIQISRTNTQNFQYFWSIIVSLYEPSQRLQTTNVTKRREPITCWRSSVSQIKEAPHTNSAAKIYKILKLRATLKCVNFPPVQAVTNLTFTRQLIGTKFFEISVHSDWGTEIVPSRSFQEIVKAVLPVSAWYLLKSFSIKFATHQPITRHYTVWTVGSVVR